MCDVIELRDKNEIENFNVFVSIIWIDYVGGCWSYCRCVGCFEELGEWSFSWLVVWVIWDGFFDLWLLINVWWDGVLIGLWYSVVLFSE